MRKYWRAVVELELQSHYKRSPVNHARLLFQVGPPTSTAIWTLDFKCTLAQYKCSIRCLNQALTAHRGWLAYHHNSRCSATVIHHIITHVVALNKNVFIDIHQTLCFTTKLCCSCSTRGVTLSSNHPASSLFIFTHWVAARKFIGSTRLIDRSIINILSSQVGW